MARLPNSKITKVVDKSAISKGKSHISHSYVSYFKIFLDINVSA